MRKLLCDLRQSRRILGAPIHAGSDHRGYEPAGALRLAHRPGVLAEIGPDVVQLAVDQQSESGEQNRTGDRLSERSPHRC
ncbi:hypothetical protein BOS5A_110028 [Bosea sp. EC-HK365B]|nr:hypothetical protein BOSE21B_10028 [Bosea sp. 21B]CAD5247657.1 hypothetical protein BOSE7B_10178 [Bosea sp. 7B]VVT50523.1 hypothetical protein BOS5A_110028 [Bosea sp. EC-HK365B]VXB00155.1 hypothetical protein BOSE127_10181 [Bosea sp. 127]